MRGFHGYGAPHPGVARTSDRKRGFCLVVDIVFEGIEEL